MAVISDPIADMLVRIKNATVRKHKFVVLPYSKKKTKILDIIKRQGYITAYKIKKEGIEKQIEIALKYKQNVSVITGIKRVSKPGLKVYSKSKELPQVLSGFGIAIISTSKGILTDSEARKENIGGEVVAYLW